MLLLLMVFYGDASSFKKTQCLVIYFLQPASPKCIIILFSWCFNLSLSLFFDGHTLCGHTLVLAPICCFPASYYRGTYVCASEASLSSSPFFLHISLLYCIKSKRSHIISGKCVNADFQRCFLWTIYLTRDLNLFSVKILTLLFAVMVCTSNIIVFAK